MRNTFHQATIPKKCVGLMINNIVPWAIKLSSQNPPFLGSSKGRALALGTPSYSYADYLDYLVGLENLESIEY